MNWAIYHHEVTHKFYLFNVNIATPVFSLVVLVYFIFAYSFIADFFGFVFSSASWKQHIIGFTFFYLVQYSFINRSIYFIYILYNFDGFSFEFTAKFCSWQFSCLYYLSYSVLCYLTWDYYFFLNCFLLFYFIICLRNFIVISRVFYKYLEKSILWLISGLY